MRDPLKATFLRLLERIGVRIEPWRPTRYPSSRPGVTRSFDLDQSFRSIPGMVSARSGFKLYLIAMSQSIRGNVIEIGSWMGRSTAFLARSCKDRGDSRLFAIDHFAGNPGKERHYGLDTKSPTDLRNAFWSNLERQGLDDFVTLYDARSEDVFEEVARRANGVRLVFIDGDHRYDPVSRDIDLYGSLLDAGGLLVLDDFSKAFPGVVRAAEERVIGSTSFGHAVQWENMLLSRRLPE